MPGASVVFNGLSSLYFEVQSSGRDVLSLPIRSPFDQLSLVKSSGRLAPPHEEGACLSPSLRTEMNRRKIFFTDDSASFVLVKRKTTHI
jgi:hypothetical protein